MAASRGVLAEARRRTRLTRLSKLRSSAAAPRSTVTSATVASALSEPPAPPTEPVVPLLPEQLEGGGGGGGGGELVAGDWNILYFSILGIINHPNSEAVKPATRESLSGRLWGASAGGNLKN